MTVKLLTKHHLEFLSLNTQARLSQHLSNATLLDITCHGSYFNGFLYKSPLTIVNLCADVIFMYMYCMYIWLI